ncbi:MAG: hypothetical protein BGO25_01150 [Acidobacteriales bacterium 59-55]|nr:hypothetical protein [Terriglobales bacterium]OJV39450.1 MAG: hypothetical protein BGO25_01150 [Acidobacteriales bacterium 59-55]
MRLAARFAVGAMLAAGIPAVFAQPPAVAAAAATPAEVSFHIERPGLPVPKFTLHVREDGTGSYRAEEVEGPSDRGTVRYASAKQIDRTLNLTPVTVAKIFKAARELKYFDMDCASKAKNIANTGEKTLSYTGTDGKGSCVYNYSENKQIKMLTDDFLAIAETMDEGRRLAYLHRYDRLGLDAETIALEQAATAGRAIEFGTIAPVLSSIAGDPAVMERVRLRVAKLLERAGGNKI